MAEIRQDTRSYTLTMYTLVMQLQNMPYFACSSYEKKSSDTCHITALCHNGHILKKGLIMPCQDTIRPTLKCYLLSAAVLHG